MRGTLGEKSALQAQYLKIMKKYFIIISLLCIESYPQGIITLVMPPGSNESGVGEAGVSNSTDLNSMFYNPATISNLYNYGGARFHYLSFKSDLLPYIDQSSLNQEYWAMGYSSERLFKYFNVGLGYYKNKVNFGKIRIQNFPEPIDSEGYETVETFVLAVRFLDILSVGGGYKFVNSVLSAPNILDSIGAKTDLTTMDFGLLVSHKFFVKDKGFYIEPLIGVSYLNHEDSAYYNDPNSKFSIPYERWGGWTLRGGYLEFLEIGYTYEKKWDLLSNEKEHTDHFGYKINISPFISYSRGRLKDVEGERKESHISWSLNFDLNKFLVIRERIMTKDFKNSYRNILNSINFWGYKIYPNIVFEYSQSKIKGIGGGIRDDQESFQFKISI